MVSLWLPFPQVHGTEGSLQMDNRNPLGISDHSTSAALCLQDTAERYRDAYRELLRHFLRTLRGSFPGEGEGLPQFTQLCKPASINKPYTADCRGCVKLPF